MKRALQHFSRGVRTEDASACGRRSAVIVGCADGQRTDFLFRGRDVAITMNSVKILHAVRSAITAIAELLVYFMRYLETLLYHPMCVHVQMDNQVIVSDYTQMDRVLRDERQYILNIVKQVKKAGCNVLLVQKSILR